MAAPVQPAPLGESPAPRRGVRPVLKNTARGFFDFINQYGVISLAIGVVIGSAVNDFVKILVDSIITPLIALISPDQSLQGFQIQVGHAVFKIGAVLSGLLSLLIVFLVVYLMVKLIIRNDELLKKK